MPNPGLITEDDEEDNYQHLASIDLPSSIGGMGGDTQSIFDLKLRSLDRPSSSITTTEEINNNDNNNNNNDNDTDSVTDDFLDKYLELDDIDIWFKKQESTFFTTIFPQIYTKTLHLKYNQLFTDEDWIRFNNELMDYGDLNDPVKRIRVYDSQCELLYTILFSRIKQKPSLFRLFIKSLKENNWYPSLSDSYQSYFNSWKLKQHDILKTREQHRTKQSLPSSSNDNCGSSNQMKYSSIVNVLHNIPPKLSTYVKRPSKVNELLSALKSIAKQKTGWVVLHGMGGSGKTVLAAQVIRQLHETHCELFSDGIFWLPIGELSNSSSDLTSQLLFKIEFLADMIRIQNNNEQLFQSALHFHSIDIGITRLCEHFNSQSNSLLILDDVWTTNVVEYFNKLSIPILVTTRVRSICPVHFPNRKFISMITENSDNRMMNIDQSIELLYNCLKSEESTSSVSYINLIKLEHLQRNQFVRQLMGNWKGLPFAIPLIANSMSPCYRQLEGTKFSKDFRNHDDNWNDDDIEHSPCFHDWKDLHQKIIFDKDYNFLNETNQLVRLSIESLNESQRDRFYDMAIFAEAIPYNVCRIIWHDLESEQSIKELLDLLISKSLIVRSVANSSSCLHSSLDDVYYSLHDITINFLRTELKSDDIKARHSKLIDGYLKLYCRVNPEDVSKKSSFYNNIKARNSRFLGNPMKLFSSKKPNYTNDQCSIDYSCLPDDNYIYHNIGYHIHSAKRYHLFGPIFLNLRFVEKKIENAGPNNLLEDYIEFGKYFSESDKAKLIDYYNFIASNSNELCNKWNDIIQMALKQPNDSFVYGDAKELIESSINLRTIYFEWMNKKNHSMESPPIVISFRCSQDVTYASYSLDSRYIVTISGMNIQMWDGTTGVEITRLDGQHHQNINHCVFSRNGPFLVTCADDGRTIVWKNLRYIYDDDHIHQTNEIDNNNRNVRSFSFDQNDLAIGIEQFQISNNNLMEQYSPSIRQRRKSGNSSSSSLYSSRHSINDHHYSLTQQILESYQILDMRSCKLKADTIVEYDRNIDSPTSYATLSNSIRCCDISHHNRFVLTGNGVGHLHLWSIDNGQVVMPAIILEHDSTNADSSRAVECVAFSSDSRLFLGLVANVVHIYTLNESYTTDLKRSMKNYSMERLNRITPPSSPRNKKNVETVQYHAQLYRKLVHKYKAYNAVFGLCNTPIVFTSSENYIYEWSLNKTNNDNDRHPFFDEVHDEDHILDDVNHNNIIIEDETCKYSTSFSNVRHRTCHFSLVAVSHTGTRLAGFEHTKNEIFLWNRAKNNSKSHLGRSESISFNTSVRFHSSIVSLCFSRDEERLLACCRSGEVTVWDIGKNLNRTSMVELTKNFSANISESSVTILAIDTKGFLRLFNGFQGDEDKTFSHKLRKKLQILFDNNDQCPDIEMPSLDITCCSLFEANQFIFGTNCGKLFHYDLKSTNLLHYNQEQHSTSNNEEYFDCEFIDSCTFIAATRQSISIFKIDEQLKSINLDQTLSLFQTLEMLMFISPSNCHIQSFRYIAKLSWIIFWSNNGHLIVYDVLTKKIVNNDYLDHNTLITSVDLSSELDHTTKRRAMIVSTAQKTIRVYIIRQRDQRFDIEIGPTMPSINQIPRSVRLASDAKFLIVGDDKGGLRCLCTDRRPLGNVEWYREMAHQNWVNDLIISPDNKFILSACESIKLWSAKDGTLLQSFPNQSNVHRLIVRFNSTNDDYDNENIVLPSSDCNSYRPKVTIVTVTDSRMLYILKTFDLDTKN